MTTLITVDTRAGYPVEVTYTDLAADGTPIADEFQQDPHVIPAGEQLGIYIYKGRELRIRELPPGEPVEVGSAT